MSGVAVFVQGQVPMDDLSKWVGGLHVRKKVYAGVRGRLEQHSRVQATVQASVSQG